MAPPKGCETMNSPPPPSPPNDGVFYVYGVAWKESTSLSSLAPPKTPFGRPQTSVGPLQKHSTRSALALDRHTTFTSCWCGRRTTNHNRCPMTFAGKHTERFPGEPHYNNRAVMLPRLQMTPEDPNEARVTNLTYRERDTVLSIECRRFQND